MNRKVTVVGGAGNVGATVARSIANRELADVVIIDIADTKAQGIALDILQACPVEGSDTRVVGGSDYALSAGSDVVVITSGVPRAGLRKRTWKAGTPSAAGIVIVSPSATISRRACGPSGVSSTHCAIHPPPSAFVR